MQTPYRLGAGEAVQNSIRKTAQGVGDNSTAVVRLQRGRGCGRDVMRRPYPHVSCDSFEVFGIDNCGVRQRQECHDIDHMKKLPRFEPHRDIMRLRKKLKFKGGNRYVLYRNRLAQENPLHHNS